jgi:hypothetical protein
VHLRDNWTHVQARTNEDIWEALMVGGLLHPAKLFLFFFYEKICKPMVDQFHRNEFERNTYPSNT